MCAAPAAAREERLLLTNCPREGGEYVATVRGRVRLHDQLLAALGPRDRAIEQSIGQQLRYLWGHYRNDAEAHAALQVTLSATAPTIRVLSSRAVPYGRDLDLRYKETAARLALEDDYTRAGVKRGSVSRSDPATLVEYEAELRMAICGRGQDPPPTVRVPLPDDPWLAYWYVPMSAHRPLRYHADHAVTNPCADDDFADLPHPYYYWYDWLPTRHGPDDEGHAFDCRTLLKPDDHYAYFDVKLKRVGAATRDLSRLRRQLIEGELTASFVYGVVDHALLSLDAASWQKALGAGTGAKLIARAAAALAKGALEGGTRALFADLIQLRSRMAIASYSTRVDGKNLEVEVRGKLAQSGRPARLRLYLGLTDVFGPAPPDHWRVLRRALDEDRVVVYYGHSGIGENFRLAQIAKALGVDLATLGKELQRSPTRLTAFLSCYSYMYFGEDLLAAGAEREDGGAFVFTGTESATHESGPLTILDLVDELLRPDHADGHIERVPRLPDDELWLIKEVRR